MIVRQTSGPMPASDVGEADDGATILIVDDDPGICDVVAHTLSAYGYRTLIAANAGAMDAVLAEHPVDLIILDVMMPGEDGLAACRRLNRAGCPPIIILSALGDEADRVVGLEIGADMYLGKPCSPRVLLAHVRAILRRAEAPQPAQPVQTGRIVTFLGWRMDFGCHELLDPDGVLVHLSDGEFAILRAFVELPRGVLSREELRAAARGPESDVLDRAIDVQVSRLRRKLRAGPNDLIRTIRNEGYMFMPQIAVV
ncbi:MAG: response regulator [Sphingobium sp.]